MNALSENFYVTNIPSAVKKAVFPPHTYIVVILVLHNNNNNITKQFCTLCS